MDGEELAAGPEPPCDGAGVGIAEGGIDGAIEGVFKDPVEGGVGVGRREEVALMEREPWEAVPALGGACHGGGGQVEAERVEARAGPCDGIMAHAAAGHQHAAGRDGRTRGEKVHKPGRGLAMVPWGVACHVMSLPIPACR